MDQSAKQAMAQQLMAQPQLPPQGGPGGPPTPMGGDMSPEQAQQVLGQMGIGPEQLPVVAQAIQTIMMAQQGAQQGMPQGGAPMPPGAPA